MTRVYGLWKIILTTYPLLLFFQSTDGFQFQISTLRLPVSKVCPSAAVLKFSSESQEDDDVVDGPSIEVVPTADSNKIREAAAKPRRRVDGLMAAVTRSAPVDPNVATTQVPLLGEIPVDGSLLVLAPAVVIGVLGFIMSIVVAFQAKDTFVDQLTTISSDISTAALAKTNRAPSIEGGCRGLCSSQETQLEGMRSFMEGLSRHN
jgi:hypothetical protein